MHPISIVSGRHPFEVTYLVAAPVCGVSLLILGTRPASVAAAMPAIVQATWQIGLVVAGLAGLCGITWRGQLATGLGVELGALVILGTTTGMYAIAVFAISGARGLAAGLFIAAAAVASLSRSAQIMRDLYRLAQASGRVLEVPLHLEEESP